MKWPVAFAATFSLLLLETLAQDPFACSPTQPCKIGCCGVNNVCGLGPDYCAPGKCISTCDQKSECDPGWGSEWSSREKCPLNVCCSKFGFCGTTKEFCGSNTVKQPSCSKTGGSVNKRVIGYYEGWSSTRACDGMLPENIPIGAYSHLNFAFAFIDPVSFAVAPMSPGDEDLYTRFTGLKTANPGLETWISIGGWSMNDPEQPTAKTFSQLAASKDAQNKFFKSLLNFMSTYGFDGVDVDWEYPVAEERSGKPEDYENFVSFLKNLKNALGSTGHKYGLTITIPSSYWYLQHFDVIRIADAIDWINVMSYDLHGTWDGTNPFLGPYINAHTNLTEIDLALDLLWRNDIDPAKIVLGLGFYGRSFTLADPSCTKPGCTFSAGGNPGKCTASAGTLSYSEIKDIIDAGAKVELDKKEAVQIVTWDTNQWVSYDDAETLTMKIEYANGKCLGGIMVWAASTDDYLGTAAQALMKATGRNVRTEAAQSLKAEPLGQCVWGDCGKDCPNGLSAAQRSDGKNRGNAGIYNGCSDGQTRNYCCPSNDVPTCEWRGGAPFCNGKCHDGEVEVTSDTKATGSSCWTGHKVLCCLKTKSNADIEKCTWSGSAPICNAAALAGPLFFYASASCPSDKPKKVTTGKDGSGGEQGCWYNGGWKSFCCSEPVPYNNCQWYQSGGTWTQWLDDNPILNLFGIGYDCVGECPVGQVPIAMDSAGCLHGKSYYCCDDSNPLVVTPPVTNSELCAVPDSTFPSSGEMDDDGDPTHLVEFFDFEDECFVSGVENSGDPGDTMRLQIEKRDTDFYPIFDVFEDHSSRYALLVKRFSHYNNLQTRAGGGSRIQKLCANAPGPTRNQRTTDLRSRPYPSVSVLRNAKQFIGQAKPLACAVAGLAASASPQKGYKYVTEHVYELQSVKQFIQSTIDNIKPGGGTFKAGKAAFSIFDTGGKFKQTWTALGLPAPSVGNTPEETIYSILGTKQDFDNFQILESKLNGLKAIVWAGFKNVIGTDKFTKLSHLQRTGQFNAILNVYDYLNDSGVQKSLESSYTAMLDVWKSVGTSTGYDFAGAFKEWNTAQFGTMTKVSLDFLKDKIPSEIAYWSSPAAAAMYSRQVRAEQVQLLTDMQKNLATKIAIATGWIK